MQCTRPVIAQFEITNKCNLRCRHCYLLESLEKHKENNDKSDLDDMRTLQIMQKILDDEIFSLTLTGGEPFVRKDILLKCIDMCMSKKISLSLNTNLLLLDEEILDTIIGIDAILVSCVSTNPELYKFMTSGGNYHIFEENLLKLIHRLNENDIDIYKLTVNMVINKRNLSDIKTSAIRLKELGVKCLAISPMTISGCVPNEQEFIISNDELSVMLNDLIWIKDSLGLHVDCTSVMPKCAVPREILEMKLPCLERSCSAGQLTAQISNRGDVRPCPSSQDIFGNILNESLENIYPKMDCWRSGDLLPDECKQCALLDECNGGCRVQAQICTKNKKGKDPWMTKKITTPLSVNTNDPEYLNHNDKKITKEMKFSFCADDLFHRQEHKDKDSYLIFNEHEGKFIFVKKHCLDFMQDMKERFFPESTAKDVCAYYETDINDKEFQKVFNQLLNVRFISLGSSLRT